MKTIAKLIAFSLMTGIAFSILIGCTGPAGQQGQTGPAGIGITSATINDAGHLVLTLTDGKTIDAGTVVGPQGPAGTSDHSAATFASVVPKVEPAIVRIDVTVSRGLASGSGTIIDERGYIVTNAHVVNNEQGIQVTLMDGTVLSAEVIGSDTKKDLAIIKLTSSRTDFPTVQLGTKADILTGDAVMAGGFPAGTLLPGPATFTSGVVSALRMYKGIEYIQTDAPFNPGNSGGCLFTLSAKMIGVPSAGITPANQDFEDINLAIPIDQVLAFINLYVK